MRLMETAHGKEWNLPYEGIRIFLIRDLISSTN